MAIHYRTEPEFVEYLDGKAHAKVSPRREHALLQLRIGRTIEDCAGDRGTVSTENDAILKRHEPGRTKLIPDVSYISEAQYRAHPPETWSEPPFSPEIAVEIRSPDESAAYRNEKIARYLATGSILVLDVDPNARTFAVHSSDDVRTFAETDTLEDPVMPWLRFSLRTIFEVLDRFKNL